MHQTHYANKIGSLKFPINLELSMYMCSELKNREISVTVLFIADIL